MTSAMDDDQLLAAVDACTLRNEDFHHRDHVRMGFLYMSRFPGLEGIRRFTDGLERLAAASGKPNLYHETITWAFLLLIRDRLARARDRSGRPPAWDEFAADNQDLLKGKDHILWDYYRDETAQVRTGKKDISLSRSQFDGVARTWVAKMRPFLVHAHKIHRMPDHVLAESLKRLPREWKYCWLGTLVVEPIFSSACSPPASPLFPAHPPLLPSRQAPRQSLPSRILRRD